MSSNRRRDASPSRSGAGSSKLRMDRQPVVTRISDPSLPIGRRKEIDNVMKKARANTNDYWDKKLLEVEEKDPNRWRHSGYKKMYIEGESSSESDRESFRYSRSTVNKNRNSRSRSRTRKSPQMSPIKKTIDLRRRSPQSPAQRSNRRSPDNKRGVIDLRRRSPVTRSPEVRRRPRSPPEPPITMVHNRTSSIEHPQKRILPRSKRPPSPPASTRSPSNSSVSCTDDSCSVCSPKVRRLQSRSRSTSRGRHAALLQHSLHTAKSNGRNGPALSNSIQISSHHSKQRPPSPVSHGRDEEKRRLHPSRSHRIDEKWKQSNPEKTTRDRNLSSRNHIFEEQIHGPSLSKHPMNSRIGKASRQLSADNVRLKNQPEPPELSLGKKKAKDRDIDKLRAKVKIEGEKRKHKDKEKEREKDSSDSEDSSSSESSFPTFAATTRLTLSERFGKMAQWSVDRSNMENMRITKDSVGGALKVMIEEDIETPQRRYSYSPAPQGHFPEELATTAPTGLLSWDDVRVRYEYYKSRGYLRDLDLKDYVKWEEWWYRYQEWLKNERYYEFYERQQVNRRRRKKIPITQRLN